MKLTRKILASLLALVMVLLMLPAAFAAEDNVHVLDVSTDLEPLAADAANAGKEIAVNDYFTVILGEKTKIDSSKKSFEDGYSATQRLNFQHKTKADDNGVILPAVKFTTSAAATIKLWWVSGGADRYMAILNADGEEAAVSEPATDSNLLYITELAVEAAGTYYLGTPEGSNYLFKMEVTEAAAEEEPPVVPAESKTLTINGAELTVEAGKWLYNTYVNELVAGDPANAYMYSMIIFDKNYTGEAFNTNGYGCAIVLDQYGALTKIYAGAYSQYWTAEGQITPAHFDANTYATVAWSDLQDGETLIIFPNDGGSNAARNWALDLRGLKGTNYFGEIAELTGFTFAEKPEVKPCEHANTELKDAKDATCTEAGYTGDTYCADCGEKIADGEEIAVLEHTYADGKCTVCGTEDPNYVPEGPSETGDFTFVVMIVMALSAVALVVLTQKKRLF